MNLHNKRLTVLGASESGVGAAILGQQKGYDVFVSDKGLITDKYRQMLEKAGIAYEQQRHTIERILAADLVVKSPGIPTTSFVVQAIEEADIPLISEIEFASHHTDAKIIAITGSNGKTTTTALIYHLLKSAGKKAILAGNIGDSFALKVATEPDPDWYVLEVSSFQLDDIITFCPHIAVITNITPDHLDRYDNNFADYAAAKFNIAQNQHANDFLIYCPDNQDEIVEDLLDDVAANRRVGMCPYTLQYSMKALTKILKQATPDINDAPANIPILGFVAQDALHFRGVSDHLYFDLDDELVIPIADLPLAGKHNQLNCMAAIMAALLAGVSPNDLSLNGFQNLPHRLEYCGTINEVAFINDSKATNVDAAWYALDAMTKPIVWIAGGTDKGNDYSILADLVSEKVKGLVCMTKNSDKLKAAYKHLIPIADAKSAEEAVQKALEMADAGDVVLLSPCCASFDLFKNYQDRGEQFKEAVKSLGALMNKKVGR